MVPLPFYRRILVVGGMAPTTADYATLLNHVEALPIASLSLSELVTRLGTVRQQHQRYSLECTLAELQGEGYFFPTSGGCGETSIFTKQQKTSKYTVQRQSRCYNLVYALFTTTDVLVRRSNPTIRSNHPQEQSSSPIAAPDKSTDSQPVTSIPSSRPPSPPRNVPMHRLAVEYRPELDWSFPRLFVVTRTRPNAPSSSVSQFLFSAFLATTPRETTWELHFLCPYDLSPVAPSIVLEETKRSDWSSWIQTLAPALVIQTLAPALVSSLLFIRLRSRQVGSTSSLQLYRYTGKHTQTLIDEHIFLSSSPTRVDRINHKKNKRPTETKELLQVKSHCRMHVAALHREIQTMLRDCHERQQRLVDWDTLEHVTMSLEGVREAYRALSRLANIHAGWRDQMTPCHSRSSKATTWVEKSNKTKWLRKQATVGGNATFPNR